MCFLEVSRIAINKWHCADSMNDCSLQCDIALCYSYAHTTLEGAKFAACSRTQGLRCLLNSALTALLHNTVYSVKCLRHIAVCLPHHQDSSVRQPFEHTCHACAALLIQLLQHLHVHSNTPALAQLTRRVIKTFELASRKPGPPPALSCAAAL